MLSVPSSLWKRLVPKKLLKHVLIITFRLSKNVKQQSFVLRVKLRLLVSFPER
jgi:hypothetical protein